MKTAFKISKLFLYLLVTVLAFLSLTFLNVNALEMHLTSSGTLVHEPLTFYGLMHAGLFGNAYENMMYVAYFVGIVIAGYGVACFMLSLFKPDRGTELSGNIIIFISSVYNFFISEFIGEMVVSQKMYEGYDSATYSIGSALFAWMGLYAGIGTCVLVCSILNIILKKNAEKEANKLAKQGLEKK